MPLFTLSVGGTGVVRVHSLSTGPQGMIISFSSLRAVVNQWNGQQVAGVIQEVVLMPAKVRRKLPEAVQICM